MTTRKSYDVKDLVHMLLLFGILGAGLSLAQAQAPGISVSGNRFVTTTSGTLGLNPVTTNEYVVLRGVNISGPEYQCVSGGPVWDSSNLPANTSDYQTVVSGMVSDWHANVVRIPLNEDCWLGVPKSGPPAVYGTNYTTPIEQFVTAANAGGLVAEVDLHVGGGPQLVNGNYDNGNIVDSFPAMDANYSLQFWQSVATAFASNPAVIFNLTNEPEFPGNGDSGDNVAEDWTCYMTGSYNGTACTTAFIETECKAQQGQCYGPNGKNNTWTVQGVASVVTAIRAAEKAAGGVNHVIIIAGLDYSNEFDDWLTYVNEYVSDPAKAIAAGVHIYYDLDCETASCWSQQEGGILAAGYPVVIDETGEGQQSTPSCNGTDTTTMVDWANAPTDSQGASEPQVGYWFWAFTNNGGCSEPALLSNNSTFAPSTKYKYGQVAQSALTSIQ